MNRIYAAIHGTQLLVIQHLRCHLDLPPAREFLVWHPLAESRVIDAFMRPIIDSAGFDAVLDMRDFQSLLSRAHARLTWPVESVRRLRADAAEIRGWMTRHGIDEADTELWVDDPVHLYVPLLRGLLRRARHVKLPHCFNLEDAGAPHWKKKIEAAWQAEPWAKRALGEPLRAALSGVDLAAGREPFDRAYTFDRVSPWSEDSIDVSRLISMEAFASTYRTLPAAVRAEADTVADALSGARRPLVLLLLFGLDDGLRRAYMKAVTRLFSIYPARFRDCTLAVKVHPGKRDAHEEQLISWLEVNVRARVVPIRIALNLEFLLPRLRPDFVWAGPCGALPIVKRLGAGHPILLPEIADQLARSQSDGFGDDWRDLMDFEVA